MTAGREHRGDLPHPVASAASYVRLTCLAMFVASLIDGFAGPSGA